MNEREGANEPGRSFLTSRLRAEPLQLDHAEILFPVLAADAALYRYIPAEPPGSPDAVTARFARLLAGPSPGGAEHWLNWVLFGRKDGSVVGTLEATVREKDRCALVAYFVFAPHRRHGLGTEAVSALVSQLFRRFPSIDLVKANIDDQNKASQALIRKAGLQQVETIFDADFFDGRSRTEYVFAISRPEAAAMEPRAAPDGPSGAG